jgi:putative endopeptidase
MSHAKHNININNFYNDQHKYNANRKFQSHSTPVASPAPPPSSPSLDPWAELSAQIRQNLDTTADPCQDFYQFACGGWLSQFQLPADRSRYSLSSDGISDANEQVLLNILTDPSGSWPVIGPFYDSCIDTDMIDSLGLYPLNFLLSQLGQPSNNAAQIMAALGGVLHRYGIQGMFSMYVQPDPEMPDVMQIQLDQGGMGLYTPADYWDNDVLNQYQSYITNMFVLAGDSPSTAQSNAKLVLQVEMILANNSLSPTERRDPYELLHPYNATTLPKAFGGSQAWNAYLTTLGLPPLNSAEWVGMPFNILAPKFFTAVFQSVFTLPPQTIYTYLRWCIINDMSQYLPSSFVQESFGMHTSL